MNNGQDSSGNTIIILIGMILTAIALNNKTKK